MSRELLISPPLRCGENQEFETDALRALLNCRVGSKRMTNVRIEHLAFSDYEEVFSFWDSCDDLHMHHDYSETPEGFSSFLKRNPDLCFVARNGDEIIGAVLGSHDGRRGFINHMAVSREFRKKGIGRNLVSRVIELLNSVGIEKVFDSLY